MCRMIFSYKKHCLEDKQEQFFTTCSLIYANIEFLLILLFFFKEITPPFATKYHEFLLARVSEGILQSPDTELCHMV